MAGLNLCFAMVRPATVKKIGSAEKVLLLERKNCLVEDVHPRFTSKRASALNYKKNFC